MTFDPLTAQELRSLLTRAVELMSPAKRRLLLADLRTPLSTPAFDATAVEHAAGELAAFIEDHEDTVAAIVNDDWNPDANVQENLWALEAELEEALAAAALALETAPATDETAGTIAEMFAAVAELHAVDLCGMGYGEVAEPSAGAQVLELWQYLYANRTGDSESLARGLAQQWPGGRGGSLLGQVLGLQAQPVVSALEKLADAGDAGAARWRIAQGSDHGDCLARYAGLAPDLSESWARQLAAQERWPELEQAAANGITVPSALLYRARMAQGSFAEAFTGAFPVPRGVSAEQMWDEAMAAGVLDTLRHCARQSGDRLGRWLGMEEPELLELPARYDHDAVKAVVLYAVARLSGGQLTAPASIYWLTAGILARLASAPGPHDRKRCIAAALAGYEQMIAFHIAGRSRNRYARAAAYWAALRELAVAEGELLRHEVVRNRHLADLRQLPALRSEMAAVGMHVT